MNQRIQHYVNHIVFAIDRSGSMSSLSNEVVKVFDTQIQHLATRSKELNQETRVSVYLFDDTVECMIYDMDVLRLPSLASHYTIGGQTALLDGTLKSIEDLEKTPQLYGDHSMLLYVLTDGGENASRTSISTISSKIKNLPDNWTVAVLVPNQIGVHEAKKFGFAPQNIQVWSTDTAGIREVGEVLRQTTDSFMRARSTGIRGTKTLFSVDTSKLSASTVKSTLQELKSDQYVLLTVHKKAVIKPFIESWKLQFTPGAAYYQLTKSEKVQGYKQVCVQNKMNGKVYAGPQARQLLGLPDYEVKIEPAAHPSFDLFLQSTSTNRNLVPGTKLLVLT